MSIRPPHAAAVSAPLAVACLVLAACGGSTSTTATTAHDSEKQLVKFTRCLREHGVNVSLPNGSSGPISIDGVDPKQFEAARNACKRYRPAAGQQNVSPGQQAVRGDEILKFTHCM